MHFWSVTCQAALCESHDGMMWFPKRHGLGWRLWKIAEIWALTNPLWKLQKNSLEQSRRQANRKQNRWGCMFSKPFTTVFSELELEHREEMSRNLERLLQGDDNFYLPLNLSTLYQSTSPRQWSNWSHRQHDNVDERQWSMEACGAMEPLRCESCCRGWSTCAGQSAALNADLWMLKWSKLQNQSKSLVWLYDS